MSKILVLSGSIRRDSYNTKLAKLAAESIKGAKLINLAEYEMPLFNQDDEAASGLPENARRLKELFIECDGFCLCSPEYNSSIPPLLKNTLDWISRSETKEEPSLIAYQGKVAALMSASPGNLGGMRALVHLRSILSSIGVLVLPTQVCIGKAYEAFDPSGNLIDEKKMQSVTALMQTLEKTASALK